MFPSERVEISSFATAAAPVIFRLLLLPAAASAAASAASAAASTAPAAAAPATTAAAAEAPFSSDGKATEGSLDAFLQRVSELTMLGERLFDRVVFALIQAVDDLPLH
jgi:hypothetical protein